MSTEEQNWFDEKMKSEFKDSYKDMKMSAFNQAQKNSVNLFLFAMKKVTGSTIICSVGGTQPNK